MPSSDDDYVPHKPRVGKPIRMGDRLDQIETGVLVWCPLCGYHDNHILHKQVLEEAPGYPHNIHVFKCWRCGHKITFEIGGV